MPLTESANPSGEVETVLRIYAITVWNTVYLTEATKILKAKGLLKEELLPHISPLGWEHINLLGEYTFDLKKAPNSNKLRPLKT